MMTLSVLNFGKMEFCNNANNSSTKPFVTQCVAHVFDNIKVPINLLSSLPPYNGTLDYDINFKKWGSFDPGLHITILSP